MLDLTVEMKNYAKAFQDHLKNDQPVLEEIEN